MPAYVNPIFFKPQKTLKKTLIHYFVFMHFAVDYWYFMVIKNKKLNKK